MQLGVGAGGVQLLLRFRRQWGNPAIRWIHDERRSSASDNFFAPVKPEFIVSAGHVNVSGFTADIPIASLKQLLFIGGCFGWRKHRLAGELRGTFERRES